MPIDYKIVCWGDYAIPVPIEAKWIAFDADGSSFIYNEVPHASDTAWYHSHGYMKVLSDSVLLIPPEPGPWTEQLYWIGD